MLTNEMQGTKPVRAVRQGGLQAVLQTAVRADLALLPILLLAAASRLYHLGSESLWLDEAFSVFVARHPFDQMMRIIVEHDTPPPLYYSLLHLWLGFGADPFWVRMLSALLGVGIVAVAYLLGREMAGPSVASAAALLTSLSPFLVWYGQEARMYSLLALLCALSAYFLLRAIRTGRRELWVGYAVTTSLATYTQISSLFFLMGEWAAVAAYLWCRRSSPHPLSMRKTVQPWLLSQITLLLLWLPWLPSFLRQSATYERFWIESPTPDSVVGLIFELSSAYLPHWRLPYGMAATVVLTSAVALLAVRRLGRDRYLFLISLFVVPIAGIYLVSLSRPIFLSRALIYCAVPFLILVAAGCWGVTRWGVRFAILAALLALNLASLHRIYTVPMKEDWEGATSYVVSSARPGDLALFVATDAQIAFDYYADRRGAELDRHGLPVDVLAVGPLEPEVKEGDLARMDLLVAPEDAFWLVESHTAFADPNGLARSYADSRYRLLDRRQFQGVTVSRYATASLPLGGSR